MAKYLVDYYETYSKSYEIEAESKEDLEMLGEMIVAASNEAYKQIDKTTQEKMGKYSALAGGFGGGLF